MRKRFVVVNNTDGIPAAPSPFKTMEEAEQFVIQFRERYKAQGYYLDSKWNKILPEDIDLVIVEVDLTITKGEIKTKRD